MTIRLRMQWLQWLTLRHNFIPELNSATTEDYDTIFIDTYYETLVVDTVSASRYTVSSKNNVKKVNFDPNDSSFKGYFVRC